MAAQDAINAAVADLASAAARLQRVGRDNKDAVIAQRIAAASSSLTSLTADVNAILAPVVVAELQKLPPATGATSPGPVQEAKGE